MFYFNDILRDNIIIKDVKKGGHRNNVRGTLAAMFSTSLDDNNYNLVRNVWAKLSQDQKLK